MKIVSMTCPNCGATLQIDADNKNVTCNYCGNSLFIDDEASHVKIDNPEQVGYQFEKGRQRAQAEQQYSQPNMYVQPSNNTQPKKRRTWLWVLGWLCIFPLPLTILLLRKKDMKPALKYGIIAAAWIVYLLIGFAGGTENPDKTTTEQTSTLAIAESTKANNDETSERETQTGTEAESTKELSEEEQIVYQYDKSINHYVILFNKCNPDNPLSSDDVFRYEMATKTLDDQAKVYRDGVEFVMRETYNGEFEILVRYLPNTMRDNDVIKKLFIQFAKPYNINLADEVFEDYWTQIIDGIETNTSKYEFDGFTFEREYLYKTDKISAFTLSGKLN